MVKYVRYGNPFEGAAMYSITMFRTERRHWRVEVSPCDIDGCVVSDPIAWDIFPDWWSARKYVREQYKIYYNYVNWNKNLF